MARKRLQLRRDDACAQCGVPLSAGTWAHWQTPERVVVCDACDASEARPSGAGASAHARGQRQRANRIARAEERYGRVGRWSAQLARGPQHERAWIRGAAGESKNAERLEKRLDGKPVVLLHDRRIPGSRANIDHIAIGPTGVTVIDSKNVNGKVKVDWHGGLFSKRTFDLYINGRKRTNLIEKIEKQIEIVRAVLLEHGLASVHVGGAMCMADVDGLPLFGHKSLRGIAIDGTRHVAKLVSKPGPLDEAARQQIAQILDHGFPPA